MKFPFHIARRYLFSKKSNNVINIISKIAIVGVTVGSMALVIVLSVFNGFEDLVVSLFNSFNPDLQIQAKQGKTFNISDIPLDEMKKIPGLVHICEVVEENALIRYKDKQYIATIKGVGDNYQAMSGTDTMIIDGEFMLRENNSPRAIVGAGIAYSLGLNITDYSNPLSIYVPNRKAKNVSINPEQAFNIRYVNPSGVFSIQQEFDLKYLIVPLDFARALMEYDKQTTALEIGLAAEADNDEVKQALGKLLGDGFVIKNRYQQQELLYKIMKSEKWFIVLILSFILLIATFNIIGSLSMLIIEKKKDITIIWSMGANLKTIKRVFLLVGVFISTIGATLGILLGTLICWLQQSFGIIKLQAGNSFVVTAYPVKIEILDILLVLFIVFIIGFITSWYPVKHISHKNLIRINE